MTWAAFDKNGDVAKSEGRTQPSSCRVRVAGDASARATRPREGQEQGTHDSLEDDVQANGGDERADARLAVVGLDAEAVLGDVLVVEDDGLGHVAVAQAAGRSLVSQSLARDGRSAQRRTYWIMAGRPKHAPLCLSQQ